MVLNYLQRAPTICLDDSKVLVNGPLKGERYNGTTRRPSLSRNRWGLLGPAVRILSGSANLVNSTVLQLRDGMTEEQRALKIKKAERIQILSLRM
jgi:TAG lipase/steryl ester hydrolase/phospholipase A2/LPA acyltransferase